MIADDVPLDSGMVSFAAALSKLTPPEAVDWPLDRQRAAWDEVCRSFRAPRPAGVAVEDIAIAGPGGPLALRIYRPAGATLRPGVLYFHGGGWVLGSLETHDDMCAEIAAGADVVVVAVDYRLAPENPHPAQFFDNLAALAHVRDNGDRHGIDPNRLLAAGDSAGGQMTAALVLHLRDNGLPQLAGQVLIYPGLGGDMNTGSYLTQAHAPMLTRADVVAGSTIRHGGAAPGDDPTALPLRDSDFRDLPPTVAIAAECDPLADDCAAYAAAITAAGGRAVAYTEPGLVHGWLRARARHTVPRAAAAFARICTALTDLSLPLWPPRIPS
jgi:acetyl esterase